MVFAVVRQRIYTCCSSKLFILVTLTFAVFVDIFLSTFVVPILPYLLEFRIGLKGANVQSSISIALSSFGLTMFVLSPVTGILIDNFSSRKWPLVLGLVAQIITTCLTATSTNMYSLCFSRVFQGAAASILWIASLATITDTVGSANMGKTMGIIGPLFNSGSFLGPMIGGVLLSSVGYWRTWLVPLMMISLDLLLRLAMIDKPKLSTATSGEDSGSTIGAGEYTGRSLDDSEDQSGSNPLVTSDVTAPQLTSSCSKTSSAKSSKSDKAPASPSLAAESSPLLHTCSHDCRSSSPTEPLSNAGYFLCILRQQRIILSILITTLLYVAYNSFNATLALHVQEAFHWGPRQVGFLFLALAGPSVLLGPFAGWLRDSFGVRWPTIVGTGIATPAFVLIGHVGDERIHWMQGEVGKGIFVGALILIGFAIELTAGLCIIEGTLVIDELEARNPGLFGPQGGYSRFFSITSMLFPFSSLIGPLLSGGLTLRFGYSVMNDIMAGLNFISLILSVLFVRPKT